LAEQRGGDVDNKHVEEGILVRHIEVGARIKEEAVVGDLKGAMAAKGEVVDVEMEESLSNKICYEKSDRSSERMHEIDRERESVVGSTGPSGVSWLKWLIFPVGALFYFASRCAFLFLFLCCSVRCEEKWLARNLRRE